MNYAELTALMRRLGCTEAMNLDGGGSSTLWLGGDVMNSPSDGRERLVANSLIVVSRQEGEGR
jgi:exopolysaccharide biosynthesis protein